MSTPIKSAWEIFENNKKNEWRHIIQADLIKEAFYAGANAMASELKAVQHLHSHGTLHSFIERFTALNEDMKTMGYEDL